MHDGGAADHPILGIFSLAVLLCWLALATYSIHAALPFNPIRLPYEKQVRIRMWFPQGWAFFTRDPREPDILPFVHNGRDWIYASRGPNSRLTSVFGVSRASRAQGVEIGMLLVAIPREAWMVCKELPERCLNRVPEWSQSIPNRSPRPTLCGRVGLARQRPIPWAWSRARVTMPSTVTRVRVPCD